MLSESAKSIPVPVEVSARHVHLSKEDVEKLFGKGYSLTPEIELSQPGQFAAKERVTIQSDKSAFENVRVLGPERKESQVEISMTDGIKLGVQAPIRESGFLDGTPGITLKGPAGEVNLDKGLIVAMRHIHMTPDDALKFGIADRQVVRIRIDGERELIYGDVLVRVNPAYSLACHLDTDEGNAADSASVKKGFIDSIQEN
jgi:acetate kinase